MALVSAIAALVGCHEQPDVPVKNAIPTKPSVQRFLAEMSDPDLPPLHEPDDSEQGKYLAFVKDCFLRTVNEATRLEVVYVRNRQFDDGGNVFYERIGPLIIDADAELGPIRLAAKEFVQFSYFPASGFLYGFSEDETCMTIDFLVTKPQYGSSLQFQSFGGERVFTCLPRQQVRVFYKDDLLYRLIEKIADERIAAGNVDVL